MLTWHQKICIFYTTKEAFSISTHRTIIIKNLQNYWRRVSSGFESVSDTYFEYCSSSPIIEDAKMVIFQNKQNMHGRNDSMKNKCLPWFRTELWHYESICIPPCLIISSSLPAFFNFLSNFFLFSASLIFFLFHNDQNDWYINVRLYYGL